jgi:hypothetical protein
MPTELYRYDFDATVLTEDIEAALFLAVWGCEALHGEAQTRLDAALYFAPNRRAYVIDAGTAVGRDLNRVFVGFITRCVGADVFTVERIAQAAFA